MAGNQQPHTASLWATEDATHVSGRIASASASDPRALVGLQVGRYVLTDVLGAGAMGIVYEALDPELDRKLAIKIVRTRGGAKQRANASARMLREAQALARLSHPNVVVIHDFGRIGGDVYVVMERIFGRTLRQWLEVQPRAPEEVLRTMIAAGRGLAAAHAAGLVHRDFKPDNVLVGDDGRVQVVDFGLARAKNAEPGRQTLSGSSSDDAQSGTSGDRTAVDSDATSQGTRAQVQSAAGPRVPTRADAPRSGSIAAEGAARPVDAPSLAALGVEAAGGRAGTSAEQQAASRRAHADEVPTAPAGEGEPAPDRETAPVDAEESLLGSDGGSLGAWDEGVRGSRDPLNTDARVATRASSPSSGGAPTLDTSRRADRSSALSDRLTRQGAIVGTPAYMAPEQHLGGVADAASDQFSFCVALYEALYGQTPFGGDSASTRAFNVIQGDVRPPPRGTRVPAWVWPIVRRGLASDASARHPSMEALLAELEADRRRDPRLWLLALVPVAIAAAFIAMRPDPGADRCVHLGARADAVWGQAARDRLTQAGGGGTLEWIASTIAQVERDLDEASTRWRIAYVDACHAATTDAGEAYARMSCLEHRLVELETTIEVLASATPEVLERGVELSGQILRDADCADPVQAARAARLAAATAASREDGDLERDLTTVDLHLRAASFAPAEVLARALVERTESLRDESARARARFALGRVLEGRGDYAEAERQLVEAMVSAERADDPYLIASVRATQALVVGDRLQRLADGRTWIALTRVALERAGGDAALESEIEQTEAFVLSHAGDHLQELAHLQRALELQQAIRPRNRLREAGLHGNLAATLAHLGRYGEAQTAAETALSLWRDDLGPAHPRVATGMATLALVADYRGDYQAAIEHNQAALDLLRRSMPADHPRTHGVRLNLAIAYANAGRLVESEAEFRAVLAARERFPEEKLDIASTLQNLAGVVRMQGRADEALQLVERARWLREQALGPNDPAMAIVYASLANSYEDVGRHEEALPLRLRVLELNEIALGREHPDLAIDLGNLAFNLYALGRAAEGVPYAERGVTISQARETKPDVKAFALIALARVLVASGGDGARALALARAAAAIIATEPALTEHELLDSLVADAGWTL